MNEHRQIGEADHRSATAQQAGIAALERELHGETNDRVEIALYVNGRMIHTKTDSLTVTRIMAILTGMEG